MERLTHKMRLHARMGHDMLLDSQAQGWLRRTEFPDRFGDESL